MSDVFPNQGLKKYQMEPNSSKNLDFFDVGISIILRIGLSHVKDRYTYYQE